MRLRRRGERDLDLDEDELDEERALVMRLGGLGDFDTDLERDRR